MESAVPASRDAARQTPGDKGRGERAYSSGVVGNLVPPAEVRAHHGGPYPPRWRCRGALVAHLEAVAPWGVRVEVEREASGEPFQAHTGGPAYATLAAALAEAYGRQLSTLGQGGSIPLCNVFADTYPTAEIILMGVEEPQALIHAPNESVHPDEIAQMALQEALFLHNYGPRIG